MSLRPAAAEPLAARVRADLGPCESEELAALHETALGLVERLELDSLLQAIVDRAGGLVGTPHGYLYLVEPDGRTLEVHVGTGIFADWVGYRLEHGDGLAGRVRASGEPVVVADYHTWTGRHRDFDDVPFRAAVGVPLRAGGEVAGVLGLAHVDEKRVFGDGDVALLMRFGQLASLALENARLYALAQAELAERRRAEEELLDTVARLRWSEHELQQSQAETIRRLAYAAEFRNEETGRHTERMSRYCELLARRLGLDDERCELIRMASPLHDVGKIAIPDRILLKRGPLTDGERLVMQQHADIGYRLLANSSSELLDLAATIARTHHERFDGRGYPRRLAGEAIPLEGRIATVADVFDALTSDRVYRPALAVEEALALMRDGRDSQFDPLVLDLFLDSLGDVEAITAGVVTRRASLPAPPPAVVEIQDERATPRVVRAPIDVEAVRAACSAAEAVLAAGGGRLPIDAAVDELAARDRGRVLASVYVLEHDRLWLVAQRGYEEVRDGFALDQGVMARAIRTGTTQFLPDVTADADFIAATSGITSEIAVPFGGDGTVVGVLNIETIGALLPEESVGLYAALAPLVEARVHEMRAGFRLDLATVARLSVHASSLRGVTAIAEFATRTLGRLLELDTAQVSLLRPGGSYHLASFWRRPDSSFKQLSRADLRHVAGIEARSGAEATYSVLDARLPGLERVEEQLPPQIVWLPLRVGGGDVGVVAGRTSGVTELDHEQIEAATLFTQHIAALIDVAQALRREQRAAVTDALTGLVNRRGLEERLREELARAERTRRELSVAMIDCDGLKAINDGGGHELGDAVLQLVADCLRTHKRLSDVAARLGGDEFVVLLPETSPAEAVVVAERFRRELAASTVAGGRRISATFGIASFPADGSTPADLLRAADRTLYTAKERGGNLTLTSTAAA